MSGSSGGPGKKTGFWNPVIGGGKQEYNPFNPVRYFSDYSRYGGIDTNPQATWDAARQTDINNLTSKVNSNDASLLTSDEKGSILGGIQYGNVEARALTYEEIKKKAQDQYNAGLAEKNRQLDTQGKAATILTDNRGVDFANKTLAEGRALRGVGGA